MTAAQFSVARGFSVHLNTEKSVFYLGDVLHGELVLTPQFNVFYLGCINIELLCCGESYFMNYLPVDEGSNITSFVRSTCQYLQMDPTTVLDARASGGICLTTALVVPIALQIPNLELPSSLIKSNVTHQYSMFRSFSSFSVNHMLKVTVYDMQTRRFDSMELKVVINAVHNYPYPDNPLKVIRHVESIFCCFGSNTFRFVCTTDKTVYGPGEKVGLTYRIDSTLPGSSHFPTVSEVKGRFIRKVVGDVNEYKSLPPGTNTNLEYFEELGSQLLPIPVLGSEMKGEFVIPTSAIPMHHSRADQNVLEWDNLLILKVKFNELLYQSVSVEVPIVINSKTNNEMRMREVYSHDLRLPRQSSIAQSLAIKTLTNFETGELRSPTLVISTNSSGAVVYTTNQVVPVNEY